MKAIPTRYEGVNYRSMLEARWAAWFKLAGVSAQYEPEAWPGYIPDFVVKLSHSHTHVCEVKGALEHFDLQKIRNAGWGVGGKHTGCSSAACQVCAVAYGNVVLLTGEGPAAAVHFWRSSGDTERTRTGSLGGITGEWLEYADGSGPDEKDMWAEAGNLVQRRGVRQ